MRFERRARLACACSLSSRLAGRAREAHQPQRPRAALQASTRAAPVPGSTRKASQSPWGTLGGRQERASVAQRVLGVKVRQNGFSGPLAGALEFHFLKNSPAGGDGFRPRARAARCLQLAIGDRKRARDSNPALRTRAATPSSSCPTPCRQQPAARQSSSGARRPARRQLFFR